MGSQDKFTGSTSGKNALYLIQADLEEDVFPVINEVIVARGTEATLGDRIGLTAADVALTNADVVLTHADVVLTNADVVTAEAAKVAAENARDATLAAYDNFDDRYLGAKAVEPTLDNDGNALVSGSLYFDTVDESMKLYTGSAWIDAYINPTGLIGNVVEDTTPQLGGDLDGNGKAVYNIGANQAASSSLSSGTYTANYALSSAGKVTATGDISIAYSGFISGKRCIFILECTDFGAYAITFPAGTLYEEGAPPAFIASGTTKLVIDKDKFDVYSVSVSILDMRAA